MTWLSRRFLLALVMLAPVLLAACATGVKSLPGTTTTVILIRHTERLHTSDALHEDGRVRATALPAALADFDIAAIYSPNKVRNLDTVRPLAAQRGLEITVIEIDSVPERMLGDYPGKTVMWVGNTTNLGNIFRRLGGEGPPPNTYGDIYILTVTDTGLERLDKRRFGR